MKSIPRNLLSLLTILCSLGAATALAEPIDFSEVSLLVRAHESRGAIMDEVSHRKLTRALTQHQESTLKSQGASDSLIQELRQPSLALSAGEVSALEMRREQNRTARLASASANSPAGANGESQGVQVFDVSVGHPINLSQWGGPDYEFAFNPTCRLDDGRPDAVMIDNFRSGTHTATYLGAGRPDDSTTTFDRRNYVSVMDHNFARGIYIDRQNPVAIKGVPYTMYPVYAAGGVSLYYIGASNDSVKLAVSTIAR